MLTIVRYGEIALKGQNRIFFENQLVENIRAQTGADVRRERNRIYVDIDKEKLDLLRNVFGIVSYSPCIETDVSYEAIQDAIMKLGLDGYDHINKFRITCQRLEKNLESSIEIEKKMGGFVIDNFGWRVGLKDFDLNICIEISKRAHVFTEKMDGAGGLPVGCSGNVGIKLDSNKSLLCAFLLMKRGCNIVPLEGFREETIKNLQRFVPYDLKDAVGEDYIALSSGESVNDLHGDKGSDMFTLTPLVGMDDEQMKTKVVEITGRE